MERKLLQKGLIIESGEIFFERKKEGKDYKWMKEKVFVEHLSGRDGCWAVPVD